MKVFSNSNITILFVATVVLLCISMKSLTGSSLVYSKIKPISINEKGEILCKTIFAKNDSGGSIWTKMEYGFCILSKKDTIIEFKTNINDFKYDPEEGSWQMSQLDSLFLSETDQNQLNEITEVILKNEYEFSLTNIDSFKVDKILSISDFETTRKISLKNNRQKGLYRASSKEYCDKKRVHLLYDFGEILIFNNRYYNGYPHKELLGIEKVSEKKVGANFDYYLWDNENGENLEFGIGKVTGILITK